MLYIYCNTNLLDYIQIVQEVHTEETVDVNRAQAIQTSHYLEGMPLNAHAWMASSEVVKKDQVRAALVSYLHLHWPQYVLS